MTAPASISIGGGADMAARDPSIPLRCSICPKRPRFSDLSHLLTHVASKGHLAQQFKTTVRASTDPVAREVLDKYNDWFQRYGVEQLCAHRLRSNEARKARTGRAGGESRPASSRVPSAPVAVAPMSVDQAHGHGSPLPVAAATIRRAPPVSPHLPDRQQQQQQHSLTDEPPWLLSPLDLHSTWPEDPPPLHPPRMHLWLTDADHLHYPPRPLHEPVSSSSSTTPSPDQAEASMMRPQLRRGPEPGPDPRNADLEPGPVLLTDLDDENVDDVMREDGVEMEPEPESQLKGVYWPGMDIFDSAPPEMRRRRNQKKDGSVLAQMQRNSTLVEPTELIFQADGELKKERRIYSPVDPGMDELDRPVTRKRTVGPGSGPGPGPSVPRPVLREKSTNLIRPPPPTRTKDGQSGTGSAKVDRRGDDRRSTRTRTRTRTLVPTVPPSPPQLPSAVGRAAGVKRPAASSEPRSPNGRGGHEDGTGRRRAHDAGRKRSSTTTSVETASQAFSPELVWLSPNDTEPLSVTEDPSSAVPAHAELSSSTNPSTFYPLANTRHSTGLKLEGGMLFPSPAQLLTGGYPFERASPLEELTSESEPYPSHFFHAHPSMDFGTLTGSPALAYTTHHLAYGSQPFHGHHYPYLARPVPAAAAASQSYATTGLDWTAFPPGIPFKREADSTGHGEVLHRLH